MPVSVADTINTITNKFDEELLAEIFKKVDTYLNDQDFLKSSRCGTPEAGYWWNVTFAGVVSPGEIKKIKATYEELGWICCVENSGDKGERAGMIGIQMRMPQSDSQKLKQSLG